MYSVKINEETVSTKLNIENGKVVGTVGEAIVNGDLIKINDKQYHLLYKNQSYNVDVLKLDKAEKIMVLRINGNKFSVQLKDQYDALLHSLGLDTLATKKINDLKAPMPGKVLSISVVEGQEVKKGDAILILEAMKMENILKSPCDGIIKKIAVSQQTVVEKNQLLIQF
jgi:biotin carboxyl carrier protein